MSKSPPARTGPVARLLFTCALVAGCGDPGLVADEPGRTVPAELPAPLEGSTVRLHRESTRCGRAATGPTIAELGSGIEFSIHETKALAAPCADSPMPESEVDVDGPSIIFDFSNVRGPGVFPNSEFEGYVLHFTRRCGDPALESATVDLTVSTVELRSADLQTHYDRLRVNLAGVRYDSKALFKIDLSWRRLRCLTGQPAGQD